MPPLARRLLPLLLLLVTGGLAAGACREEPTATSTGAPAPSGSASAAAAIAPPPHGKPPATEGSTVARAAADDALYVADEDHGVVRRIPLPFDPAAPVITVPMPGLPAQVLALDGRVLVTVRSEGGAPPAAPAKETPAPAASSAPAAASARASAASPAASAKASHLPASPTGPGLLSIMRPDPAAGLVEVARVELPADAWGLAVTPDEKTALVTSAWTHQVSAVDLATAKKTWSIDVPREPRAVVVRPDGASAYVTHLVGAAVTRLDGLPGQPSAHPVVLPPSPLRSPSGKTLDATLAYSAALSPDGSRLFVARHAIGALGDAAWFGAATVDVLLTAGDTPLAPRRESARLQAEAANVKDMMAMFFDTPGGFPRVSHVPFVEPRAMVYRRSSKTLLVASEGTNRVVELDARSIDPTLFVKRSLPLGGKPDPLIPVATSGGAPSGLALSADESIVWVYCRSTDDLIEVHLTPPAKPAPPTAPVRLRLAEDLLGEPDGKGRRIFYDATDRITSGGVACAGCHPEGRDDGHVWHEATFATRSSAGTKNTNFLGDADQAPLEDTKEVGHPRQTPMLAGRVTARGPYGWHAESPDLVARLKAGFGLHRWGMAETGYGDRELLGRAQYLTPFLRHGLVPPPREVHPPTPEEARGKEIFGSNEARCSRCHVPETEYTDRAAYPFSRQAPLASFEDEASQEFKTPSLFFVGGTAPYFHDGRASSLEELVEKNGDRMGRTGQLSREDRAALVAFLRTL